jgi:energy-coupling factor transport system ATP-binding protein
LIEVKDIHYIYPNGVKALNGISLVIQKGDFVAIMGENGAGKTTLAKHFNGLLKPTEGSVLVDRVDTQKASIAQLSRKVGFVFQNPDHQLFCETVEDEIEFALKNFGFDIESIKKQVDWAINLLDLEEYRKTSPFMLSGGERKRVALASVIAWNPEVIVIDEPTIGQDAKQKGNLKQFIEDMIAKGKTVIAVTHDIEFVAECDPKIVLMSKGRILAEGIAKEVLTNQNLITEASLVSPQISLVLRELSNLGLPCNVIDLNEAMRIIEELLGMPYERV